MKYQRKEEVERDIVSHSNAALVTPRDPEAWTNPTYNEDKKFKKERSKNGSQHGTNYLLQSFLQHQPAMRLTIGRQRL